MSLKSAEAFGQAPITVVEPTNSIATESGERGILFVKRILVSGLVPNLWNVVVRPEDTNSMAAVAPSRWMLISLCVQTGAVSCGPID